MSETIENEAKRRKGAFLGMLMDTLDASLLGNILPSKGLIWAGKGTIRAGEEF